MIRSRSCWDSLQQDGRGSFPNVDLPIVTITTNRGTSVEEMETGVTKMIEEAVNTISGIDELRSTTKEGISSVVITFCWKNRDIAQQEVQGKINTILSRRPAAPMRRRSINSTSMFAGYDDCSLRPPGFAKSLKSPTSRLRTHSHPFQA
jgi:multidrug efflux pump subunit AcrB